MDTARCTEDGVSYYAHVFAALPVAELERKRRALVCDVCGHEAYFRKASTRGQDACFGARPHAPGCSAAAPESGQVQAGGDEQDILDNPGDTIVLDLDYGAHDIVNPGPDQPGGNAGGRGGRYTGQGARPSARTRRRLRPILRNLIYSDQFRESSQTIEIPNRGPFAIRDFFVHFGEIDRERHFNKFRGYWGMAVDVGAADDEGGIWLNSGSYRSFSILVSNEVKQDLLRRLRKTTQEQLAGCHVLVLGTLNRSIPGKLWVRLEDVGHCAVYED